MRHASFQGLREDKTIEDINVERKQIIEKEEIEIGNSLDKNENENYIAASSFIDLTQPEVVLSVDNLTLKFTNIQKWYWKKERLRKGDLLNYYHAVAEYMLPYMKDRPQSLHRHPDGIDGPGFYHKDMKGKVERGLQTHRRFSESAGEYKNFLVCTNEASLLYMANLGCIEMNPWHSRIQTPDNPDWCVIDLDPGTNTFEEVIETALVVKKVLESYNVASSVKTSGSTGLHIYIPFGGKYTYDQSKAFAELIANMVHDELSLLTSLERNPLKRTDKIYIDYLQNRPIQTICAPYSCRPKPGATVSAPLHWDEVKKGLQMNDFTIKNMMQRIKAEGDLFTPVLEKGINLKKVLEQLTQQA